MTRLTILIIALTCLYTTGCDNKDESPKKFILINGVSGTQESFQEIKKTFETGKKNDIAVGIGFIVSYLHYKPAEVELKLINYLSLSEQFELPVIIQLDGEQWWEYRSDLWNWWDENIPGYNPENKKNVEWFNWSPDSAMKVGWRNWGRQLRVRPAPNLMSTVYRESCHAGMGRLVPIIVNWWKNLPEEKKYLFVGVKVGWESSIGVNTWYYPNGNALLDEPEPNDPDYGINMDLLPDRGVKTIGYAAVSTLGLAVSGQLQEEDITKVVRIHLEDLSKFLVDNGIPREKIFTHCGGWSQGETLYSAAVNQYSCPGWSFYDHAANPKNDVTAMKALELSDAPYWGAVEWLYVGEHSEADWENALQNTLIDNRVRYMCIYNWNDIKKNQNAISAIHMITKK